eukprot:2336835-Rhodomonas_salina.1
MAGRIPGVLRSHHGLLFSLFFLSSCRCFAPSQSPFCDLLAPRCPCTHPKGREVFVLKRRPTGRSHAQLPLVRARMSCRCTVASASLQKGDSCHDMGVDVRVGRLKW